jgi:predicted secreted protein
VSNSIIGFGTKVQVGNGGTTETFTDIPEIVGDIDGPSTSMSPIEVTPHKTSDFYREYKPGLIDPGEIGFKMNYIKDNTVQEGLKADFDARTLRHFRMVFPDSYTVAFTGFVSEYSQSEPSEAAITYQVKIKISGAIAEVVA